MSDIRQNSTVKDDFNRANEDPLSGGGNWARVDLAANNKQCVLGNFSGGQNFARHKATNDQAFGYWTPDDELFGDDSEAWCGIEGNEVSGQRWAVGFWKDRGGTSTSDGYIGGIETANINDVYRIYRATNNAYTSIAITGDVAPEGEPVILLLRRNGTSVELWSSVVAYSGTPDFSLVLSVVDNTHTGNFKPGIHCTNTLDLGAGMDNFGSGPPPDFIPQIYRRL